MHLVKLEDLPQQDFRFFASVFGQGFGRMFSVSHCGVDQSKVAFGNNSFVFYPYHDLSSSRNRIRLSHFNGNFSYRSEQSAAIHSNMFFSVGRQKYHMQHWVEEGWRITGHRCHTEHVCLLAIYSDPLGFGLVNLEEKRAKGAATTIFYEDNHSGRKDACRRVFGFLWRRMWRPETG